MEHKKKMENRNEKTKKSDMTREIIPMSVWRVTLATILNSRIAKKDALDVFC